MTDSGDINGEKSRVGYKNPPVQTRFKPGQSGNRRGRQKGLRNLSTDVKRMLEEPIKVTVGGKERRVSSQEAALKRLREKALKGDARALDRLLAMAERHKGEAAADLAAGTPLDDDDRAILDAYGLEILRDNRVDTQPAEDVSTEPPAPIPDPD
jgi:hypothetical protein